MHIFEIFWQAAKLNLPQVEINQEALFRYLLFLTEESVSDVCSQRKYWATKHDYHLQIS